MKRLFVALPLVASLGILAGCSAVTTDSGSPIAAVSAGVTAAEVLADNEEAFVGESSYNTSSATAVDLSSIEGDTYEITAAGTYVLSGSLDGQVVVNAEGADVTLVLDGATVSSSTSAAIAATAVENLSLILADGSTNTLSDTSSYASDADVNAALYSAGDLMISGDGALEVTGNGNDGIASKDGLAITSGTISVTAVDDGIRGKDSLVVSGGTIEVDAGGDGLKADNDTDADRGYIAISAGTVSVTSGGDALQAETDLVVTGGSLSLESGGGAGATLGADDSAKALKSSVFLVVEGGTIEADAADDAINVNGAVHLSGGSLSLASGDDAVHAESELLLDGAAVDVTDSVEGLESASILIADGEVTVRSTDDAINASDGSGATEGAGMGDTAAGVSVLISGGTVVLDSDGDGLDSNGTAQITGGSVTVYGPTNDGNGALDVNGSFTISGGELLAAGSSGMAVTPGEDSEQVTVAATFDQTLAAGTLVEITAADGTVLATFEATKDFSSIVYSSADVEDGAEYSFVVDGTSAATATGGVALAGGVGGMPGGGGPGGGPGGDGDR
ncbi:carbohydrate-binding domain-containing protein [Glaciihabitans arcticus]|uniref:Carbohydrate-binding domain-containing protein n=1 Tax=Glaciihabitans arcticus TaxID=2668039 RepID=A0A4Q9GP51_9MICO|nr:carbohydrate-binding domain-containing protein [Glaciihabitans arcticus]TBN56516.1 carbohydrate-binding domain-containing protein [Glaciihabitans arcticus]